MLSCIGGGRLQITGRAEYNARLGGSINDFIYAALCTSPLMADSVEKVQSVKSLQICENTIDIFD